MREATTDHLLFFSCVGLTVIVLASASLLFVDGSTTEAWVSFHLLKLGDGDSAGVVRGIVVRLLLHLLLSFFLDNLVAHWSLLLILLAAFISDAAISCLVLVHMEPYFLIIFSNRN